MEAIGTNPQQDIVPVYPYGHSLVTPLQSPARRVGFFCLEEKGEEGECVVYSNRRVHVNIDRFGLCQVVVCVSHLSTKTAIPVL